MVHLSGLTLDAPASRMSSLTTTFPHPKLASLSPVMLFCTSYSYSPGVAPTAPTYLPISLPRLMFSKAGSIPFTTYVINCWVFFFF